MSEEYGPATYGDRIADAYDSWPRLPADAPQAASFLSGLAGEGPVLELGVGTGRIALPLRELGLEIHGVDASEAMVAKLREKPGGDLIRVTMGDFADVPVEESYPLIFVAFNTFFALLTQEDQVRCFANVAGRLLPGGAFVIQAFVPDLTRFEHGQRVEALSADMDRVDLSVATHEPALQRVHSQHLVVTDRGISRYPVEVRYAWPSELDLMGLLAGLRLRERVADWERRPFTGSSPSHVSVYEKGPVPL